MCKPVKCPQCGHEFTPERAKSQKARRRTINEDCGKINKTAVLVYSILLQHTVHIFYYNNIPMSSGQERNKNYVCKN